MEIKFREVIFSVMIIAVMVGVGSIIGGKISNNIREKNERYYKATMLETPELFKYGIQTETGDVFSYGPLDAIDTINIDNIGPSISISRDLERYTTHTRQVAHTNGKGHTYYTTETYHTWDHVKTDLFNSKNVKFNGVIFPTESFPLPDKRYVCTKSCGLDRRYKYYVNDTHYDGTLFANFEDGRMSDAKFFVNVTLYNALDKFTIPNAFVLFFWIPWALLTIGIVIGFYYLDNNWLD